MDVPSRQQRRPILQDMILLCLQHRQRLYHICSDSQCHLLARRPNAPSSRLPQISYTRGMLSFLGRAHVRAVCPAHWQGNAESLYVGNQSLGSNGYPGARGERQRQGSE